MIIKVIVAWTEESIKDKIQELQMEGWTIWGEQYEFDGALYQCMLNTNPHYTEEPDNARH